MSKKIYSPLIQDPLTKKYYRQELKLHEGLVLTGQQQFISDLTKQRDDYKTQRDTLIDDIAVLRANNERLEEELKRRREEEENLEAKLSAQLSMKRDLEKENEEKTKVINLYKKAYEKTHKGWFRYRELTNHIRDMKFASPYSYNYIHLVNFIKELERVDDEKI